RRERTMRVCSRRGGRGSCRAARRGKNRLGRSLAFPKHRLREQTLTLDGSAETLPQSRRGKRRKERVRERGAAILPFSPSPESFPSFFLCSRFGSRRCA